MLRIAGLWQPNDAVRVTPSILYQNSQRNDVTIYWPEYSDPSKDRYVSANPTARPEPDVFYLPSLNVQADMGPVRLISTTSYFHRDEISGYDGTLYNLGYYQSQIPPYGNAAGLAAFPLLDGSGVHLPAGLTDYRAPASVTNTQRNLTQEFRLQSTDPAARVGWTAGVFYSLDRQFSLEEIHDPMADAFFNQLFGYPIADFFGTPLNPDGSSVLPMGDSYFNRLVSYDRQIAGFGEVNFNLTDTLKLTAGVRVSKDSFTIESLSGGPQNSGTRPGTQSNSETPVTPKAGIQWQVDPNDMYYFTYSKGFRPGGGNPSIPYDPTFQNPTLGCTQDFLNLGLPKGAPATYKSDSVQSFEVGAKNNIENRVRLASSIYYIKWNNIQENVVPPICQIQFTENLGDAVSKGIRPAGRFPGDRRIFHRVELRLHGCALHHEHLSRAGAHRGCRWWPPAMRSPGRTASAPATRFRPTRFPSAWNTSSRRSRTNPTCAGIGSTWPGISGCMPPRIPTHRPTIPPACRPQRESFASLRAGTKLGDFGVSLFVDNLTDTHTILNYNHQTNTYDARRQLAGESRVPVHFLSAANIRHHRDVPSLRSRTRYTLAKRACATTP